MSFIACPLTTCNPSISHCGVILFLVASILRCPIPGRIREQPVSSEGRPVSFPFDVHVVSHQEFIWFFPLIHLLRPSCLAHTHPNSSFSPCPQLPLRRLIFLPVLSNTGRDSGSSRLSCFNAPRRHVFISHQPLPSHHHRFLVLLSPADVHWNSAAFFLPHLHHPPPPLPHLFPLLLFLLFHSDSNWTGNGVNPFEFEAGVTRVEKFQVLTYRRFQSLFPAGSSVFPLRFTFFFPSPVLLLVILHRPPVRGIESN